MTGYGPSFVDATAFDRMPADFNPYGEYPDGTPCAYCLINEGEVKPQGWNLIGPICRWCLADWHRTGSALVFWRRQKAWAVAILGPLTDTEGGARPPRNCDLILTGKLEPILQWKISEYVVAVHGSDDASPRRAQASIWINVCRSLQAARVWTSTFPRRGPPPNVPAARASRPGQSPPYRQPPLDLHDPRLTRYTPISGHEERRPSDSSSSSFEID